MLKGGLVGFGRMGITHFSLLNTHPEVAFKAVCDPSRFVTNNLATFAKSVEIFTDYKRMLEDVELDFLIIATPTASHAEVIEAALEKGLHVFVEKPFVLDTSVGTRLAETAETAGVVNQVGYFLRFNEVFNAVRQILAENLIGQPLHFKNEMYGRTVLAPTKKGWRSKKALGGGCMLDFASHAIDLADFFFGPPGNVTGSVLKRVYSKKVEDAVYTTLTYDNDLTGHLLVNWSDASYRRPYNRIEIIGTTGRIIADRQEYRLYLREPADDGQFEQGWNVRYLPELARHVRFDIRGSEFTSQLDHFIDCIAGKMRTNVCSFADGLQTDRVIEAIERNSRERTVRCG